MRRAFALAAGIVALATMPTSPGGAARERPPEGVLTLDMADPAIDVMIGTVPLRLRVSLNERDPVELNDDVADRLALPFERGPTDNVGRIPVPSLIAPATFEINGHPLAVTLSSHGRCCEGADGVISAALLPYAEVRFIRAGAPGEMTRQDHVMTRSTDFGLEGPQRIGRETVRLHFDPLAPETVATAAAGAIVARAHGGALTGGRTPVPVAFGIARPARMMTLASPATLAGFRFDRLWMRTADFGGRYTLPEDEVRADEILVRRRVSPQMAWPAITIGSDRLDRCREIRFVPATLALSLTCAFGT